MVLSLKKVCAKVLAEQILLDEKKVNLKSLSEDIKDLVSRELTKAALINKRADVIEKDLNELALYALQVKEKWKKRRKDYRELVNELTEMRDLLRANKLDPETRKELKAGGQYLRMIADQSELLKKSDKAAEKYGKMLETLEMLCKKFKPDKNEASDVILDERTDEIEKIVNKASENLDSAQEAAAELEPMLKSAEAILTEIMKLADS